MAVCTLLRVRAKTAGVGSVELADLGYPPLFSILLSQDNDIACRYKDIEIACIKILCRDHLIPRLRHNISRSRHSISRYLETEMLQNMLDARNPRPKSTIVMILRMLLWRKLSVCTAL